MASSAVVAAFEARLAAEWGHCPVVVENSTGETPEDGSPFMIVSFPLNSREQITFGMPGENTWRETGAARLVLSIRSGAGTVEGRQWADDLVLMFAKPGLDSNVIVRGIDGPATDDRNDDGQFFRLAIAVAYEFDFYA